MDAKTEMQVEMSAFRTVFETPRRTDSFRAPITARVWFGHAVVAIVDRRRKTKRSKWEVDVRLCSTDWRYPRDPAGLLAFLQAVITYAADIRWPEADVTEDTTDGR